MGSILVFIVIDTILIALSVTYLLLNTGRRRKQRDFHIKLITILTATIGLRDLLERAAMEIKQATDASHASFFVYKDDDHFVSGGTNGYIRPTRSDCHLLEHYFTRVSKRWVYTSSLSHESEIRRLLRSYRIEFTMPLIRGDDVIGFLFLGKKTHGAFNSYDIQSVTKIQDELSITIQNAASIESVKELNSNLQQRIDAATDELRSSNEQLRSLDKAKDEFLSLASHQLRTPLTSVKGYISMVLEGDAGKVSKAQKQLLTEAFTSSERMVHLINDFLSVSRIQTGKFLIERHETDLIRVVRQEVRLLERTAETRGLKLKVVVPDKPVVMALDEGKIRQVIMNFIDNALYYSPPDTEIVVTLYLTPGEVAVKVQDHGMGVPLKQQARLFTKFFRADNARTQRPDGTGVGLFLAKKVIDGHGGKLIFASKEGHGSTFGFRLPLPARQPNNADDTKSKQ